MDVKGDNKTARQVEVRSFSALDRLKSLLSSVLGNVGERTTSP